MCFKLKLFDARVPWKPKLNTKMANDLIKNGQSIDTLRVSPSSTHIFLVNSIINTIIC